MAVEGEDLDIIREGFARLLAEKCSEADVRQAMSTVNGDNPELWRAISDMGITALLVPEEFGGIGAGAVAAEVVMEEAGAALLSGPLLTSSVLATSLIARSADESAKARLLPRMASGDLIATVALTGPEGRWDLADIGVEASDHGKGWTLAGSSSYVLCAEQADTLLVIARCAEGLGCFEVDPSSQGVAREPLETWDKTLRLARLDFADVKAVRIEGVDARIISTSLDLARIALAGEQAGGSRRIFNLTIDYLKTRVQFGRQIGGFQAMKHMAADLLIEVESATSAARAAAAGFDADAPDKQALIALAGFACADVYVEVAATAIQMHGGIAFTWEHPAHLYLRRARAAAQLFGQSDAFRERYVAALEQAA